MLTSIIIRTFNEQKHVEELLDKIAEQEQLSADVEVIVVDSGSTDRTLEIAEKHTCRITHIAKEDFTFGRSLNDGCKFANGEILVFVSGHCIPVHGQWLDELIKPIVEGQADYTYGKQEGYGPTKFSERCHFEKWFPDYSKIPQKDFFCNNANAAIRRSTWEQYPFDEELTGLEDMDLAKRIMANGQKLAYVSTASVYHIHEERWGQVKLRYEREAIALQQIMPEVHFSLLDFLRFYCAGVFSDIAFALRNKVFFRNTFSILMFRLMQFWGTYRGNHQHRRLSAARKYNYFYPKDLEKHDYKPEEDRRLTADESQ